MPANLISFEEVCELLENLLKRKKQRQKQEEILYNKFDEFKLKISEVETTSTKSMFPVLRLLVPDYDRERGAYNIKEAKLGKLLVNVLQLDEKSREAKILQGTASGGRKTDLAEEAYYIIKNNMTSRAKCLTVGDINEILDKIANAETGNEKREKNLQKIFTGLMKTVTASQCKWVFRIILKDLKIGMSSKCILSCFYPDGPECYDTRGILSKVCEELSDGNNRQTIEIFYPISPMFSARLNVTEINQCLSSDKTYHIETKFDGERFQMHMENGKFKYFSRRGYDFTDSFGSSYDNGPLTSFLKNCFASEVKSFILDGEMMGWHTEKQEFGSKGMPYDIKHLGKHSVFRPCYCVFDVLYYNGRSLVGPQEKGGLTLKERCKILDNIFVDVPGYMHRSKRTPVENFGDILNALNTAIDNREEGIVVKDINSFYRLNNRNAGWHKVKPEYTKGSAPDLDLVIIGAYRGEALKHGIIKSFLLACVDSDTPDVLGNQWICVGGVGNGLTYEEHDKLCAKLQPHWKEVSSTPPPPNIRFNKAKPHFWIKPEDSVVLEICATELTQTKEFASEYTLRFPRIERIREDKPIADVMTISEYDQLCPHKAAVNKLSTTRIEMNQIDMSPKVPKKRQKKELKVSDDFKVPNCDDVDITSNALQDRKICILSDDEDCSKSDLARIVKSHGGEVVANYDSSTWCCIAGRKLRTVCSLIENQTQDVLSTAWLRSLPRSDTLCSFEPLDALCFKKETKLKMARCYDDFGDSYTDFIDEETLKRCLNYMDEHEPKIYITSQETAEMDKELFGDNNTFSFLRPCFIHFLKEKALSQCKAKMYGATLCDKDDSRLTHVIISKETPLEEIQKLKQMVDIQIIYEDWLEACFVKETLVPEFEFIL
ncbi:hypothetical protein K1T71_001723 [Dendrolimus kikuchii]|uniref:Uncharacterized protein n=1 Tax=Dendrolimus kikuchii TaxID=765133 RepID=A0ACC1DEI1_9NEOP|nr:hypothetical protein K1T71_001723 [Dendrolimus kikuchii]